MVWLGRGLVATLQCVHLCIAMNCAIALLPPELQRKIFTHLSPDLQTLLLTGHIVVTSTRTVSLPSSMTVGVFLVGGGANGLLVRYLPGPQPIPLLTELGRRRFRSPD